MAAINGQQIKKIYAIGNALGIVERGNEEDALHSLVAAITGKGSVRALTSAEAQAVINDLQQRQGTPPPRRKPKTHTERPGGATAAQQRKVWALLYELQKADTAPSRATLGQRLCGILKKELHIDALPKEPFAWIDFETCNRLIEILKKYVANAGKGPPGGEGA